MLPFVYNAVYKSDFVWKKVEEKCFRGEPTT